MNQGTQIRTILVVATCLNTALMATDVAQFHNPTVDLVYRILSVILNFIIVATATYFNNDFTVEADMHTKQMRQDKKMRMYSTEYVEEPDDASIEEDIIEEESEVESDE